MCVLIQHNIIQQSKGMILYHLLRLPVSEMKKSAYAEDVMSLEQTFSIQGSDKVWAERFLRGLCVSYCAIGQNFVILFMLKNE